MKLEDLCPDVMEHIASMLDTPSVASLAQTATAFRGMGRVARGFHDADVAEIARVARAGHAIVQAKVSRDIAAWEAELAARRAVLDDIRAFAELVTAYNVRTQVEAIASVRRFWTALGFVASTDEWAMVDGDYPLRLGRVKCSEHSSICAMRTHTPLTCTLLSSYMRIGERSWGTFVTGSQRVPDAPVPPPETVFRPGSDEWAAAGIAAVRYESAKARHRTAVYGALLMNDAYDAAGVGT